jgi:hypothetical protein
VVVLLLLLLMLCREERLSYSVRDMPGPQSLCPHAAGKTACALQAGFSEVTAYVHEDSKAAAAGKQYVLCLYKSADMCSCDL